MFLAIDIGNSSTKFGIFQDDILIKTERLDFDKTLTADIYQTKISDLLQQYHINECLIASVNEELTFVVKKAIDNLYKIESLLLDSKINIGIKIKAPNPEQAGADRIANTYAASVLYPKPSITIDVGTATTFDVVDKDGCFIGGVIMPGLNMQLKSLNDNTSKLPIIKVGPSYKAIGDDTESCILSGVIRGHSSAIEGLIRQCEEELGEKAAIIATGGYSKLISQYMNPPFEYIEPDLTLKGIKLIYNLNKANYFV